MSSLNGKTLRLNDDGSVPADNPFVGQKNARPEIWSYGHRNSQGIAWQPETNLMFQTEHGPSGIDGVSLLNVSKRFGGDEVNIVERGKNYGWDKDQPYVEKRRNGNAARRIFSGSRAGEVRHFIAAMLFRCIKEICFSAR